MFDEDEAGRAGRQVVLQRLSLRAFARVDSFVSDGFQPEQLTTEEARLLQLA